MQKKQFLWLLSMWKFARLSWLTSTECYFLTSSQWDQSPPKRWWYHRSFSSASQQGYQQPVKRRTNINNLHAEGKKQLSHSLGKTPTNVILIGEGSVQELSPEFKSSACSATKHAERSHLFEGQQAYPRQRGEFTCVAKPVSGIWSTLLNCT